MRKVFSFDAETDGLWGNPFAVAAIVYTHYPAMDRGVDGKRPERWEKTAQFFACLPLENIKNDFAVKEVVPALAKIRTTHETYKEMLKSFSLFYMQHKEGSECIAHMGYIVEAHLLREMHRLGFIGDFDAPYPLYDVSGNLQAAGEDATSVDDYAKKHGICTSEYGSTHNPLYDCAVAAEVYIHLTKTQ